MFKRRNNHSDIDQSNQQLVYDVNSQQNDLPEWEEVTDDLLDKKQIFSQSSAEVEKTNRENDDFDISAFPAIRMALGFNSQGQTGSEEDTRQSIGTAEDGLSSLIQKYAGLEEDTPLEAEQSDLPELFRQGPEEKGEAEESGSAEETDIQPEEFEMEAELQKQQAMSGELFDFIDCIVNDTKQTEVQREQIRRESAKEIVVDPYNTTFNDRYDDREDILNSTAEISLAPKYKMEG